LLSTLCLAEEGLLDGLETKWGVTIDFDPRRCTLALRGENTVECRRELKQLLFAERQTEELVECPAAQFDFLLEDAAALPQLQQLCAPALLALQELPPAVSLMAPSRLLADAVAMARDWLADHAPTESSLPVPPEVVVLMRGELPTRAAEWRVQLSLKEAPSASGGGAAGASTLHVSGPSKLVRLASEAAAAFVRNHAHVEERIVLSAGEFALVSLLLARRHAPPGVRPANGGAPAVPSGIFGHAGVEPLLVPAGGPGADGKPALLGADGQLVLRGTAARVGTVKAQLEALLIEAERTTRTMSLSAAQVDRLTARGHRGDAPMLKRLQEAHMCALVLDRTARTLQIVGTGGAGERVETILNTELDVDEHSREVSDRLVPIIIGRGGSNIKRLIAESGAQVDLDRSSRRVTVRGRKAQVAKAVAMLDELVGEAGEEEEIPVPARQLGLIIGRGGATIRQLQADSGATIDVRKDVNSVKVRGSAAQVEKATGLIRELLSGAEAARTAAGPPPGLRPQPPPAAPPGLAAASPPGL
jgi:hypothetical protein